MSAFRERIPLTSRPLDLVYFCFFVFHLPATILIDCQHLYPSWLLPHFLNSLQHRYLSMSNDPLVGAATGFFGPSVKAPVWFFSFLMLEVVFQLPVFYLAARGLYKGSRTIYVLILTYGASTFTTLLPCIATLYDTPTTSPATIAGKVISVTTEQRILLLSSYVPFAIIPLIMVVDMSFRISKLMHAGIKASQEDKRK